MTTSELEKLLDEVYAVMKNNTDLASNLLRDLIDKVKDGGVE